MSDKNSIHRRGFAKSAAAAGAMSCLTGIAARTSIERSRPVKIAELIRL